MKGPDVKTYDAPTPAKGTRPLLGVRERPGRLALAVFRLPLPLYRAGWGWLLGHTFVLVVHAGRKTGQPHAMTAMVLRYEPATSEVVVCANWGPTTDWIRNIRARPALRVQIGRESFAPQHRFLTNEESFAVAVDFRRRHPHRVRFAGRVLGWGDLRSEEVLRDFVATRPFVAFRPVSQGLPAPPTELPR
jgi:deazaflavin-dependent oxidoreductase (nitroreductase family)